MSKMASGDPFGKGVAKKSSARLEIASKDA